MKSYMNLWKQIKSPKMKTILLNLDLGLLVGQGDSLFGIGILIGKGLSMMHDHDRPVVHE